VTPSVQGAFPACHLLLTHQACLHAVVVAGSIVRQIYRLRVRAMLTRVSGRERRGRPAQAARQAAGAAPRPCGAHRKRPPLHLVRHCRRAPCRLPARPACMRMQTGARQRAPQHQDVHMLGCLQQGAVWLRRSPLQGPAKLLQVLLHGFSVYGGAGNVPGRLVAGPWRAPGRHRTRVWCSAAGARVYMHGCAGQ